MKIRMLYLSLLLCCFSSAGADDKFGLSLKTGANFTGMRVKEKSTGQLVNTQREIKPTFLLEAEFVVGQHLSYIGGLQFLSHGYSSRGLDSIYTYQSSRRATYLGFVNKLRLFLWRRKAQPYLSFGVNAETLLAARFRSHYDDPAIPNFESNIKVLYNELLFTPEFDLGLRYALKGFFLTLEGTCAYGSENVNNPDLEGLATHDRRIRDLRLLIGISAYVY